MVKSGILLFIVAIRDISVVRMMRYATCATREKTNLEKNGEVVFFSGEVFGLDVLTSFFDFLQSGGRTQEAIGETRESLARKGFSEERSVLYEKERRK